MFKIHTLTGLLLAVALLLQGGSLQAFESSDLPELKRAVVASCPSQWESIYSSLLYINGERVDNPTVALDRAARLADEAPLLDAYEYGDDIWHGRLADESRYITYANKYLLTRSETLTIELASHDAGVILACANARTNLIDTLVQARNDETRGFNINLVRDDDGDGVFNLTENCEAGVSICINDTCPDTPAGETADAAGTLFAGCSASQKDTDGDNVNDHIDRCDDTPLGAETSSLTEFLGCSATQKDTDRDGLNNAFDACPDTDAGLDVNAEGCARNEIDSDGDGINDADDPYPLQNDTQCFP